MKIWGKMKGWCNCLAWSMPCFQTTAVQQSEIYQLPDMLSYHCLPILVCFTLLFSISWFSPFICNFCFSSEMRSSIWTRRLSEGLMTRLHTSFWTRWSRADSFQIPFACNYWKQNKLLKALYRWRSSLDPPSWGKNEVTQRIIDRIHSRYRIQILSDHVEILLYLSMMERIWLHILSFTGLIGWVPNTDTLHALIREYRGTRKIPLNYEHRVMLNMAPDYDHLTVIQKVEVFRAAIDETSGKWFLTHLVYLVRWIIQIQDTLKRS